jgi:dinuclear metal center YbgI/SA1388 family protein
MSIKTIDLHQYLNNLLSPALFDDYCPNGLQIEGKDEIKKIIFSVSATRYSAEYAAQKKACALICHHGLFWKFHGTKPLTGAFYKRVAPLVKNDINLFGYHLPLDAHHEVGNAASLAKLISLNDLEPFGQYKGAATGIKGTLNTSMTGSELKKKLEVLLNHQVYYSNPEDKQEIKSIGIITGGANSEWKEAKKERLDAYITGEMSEHDYHESRESNIHMFAGGHHATEKFGILALMKKVQTAFPDLECEFLDSDNPA